MRWILVFLFLYLIPIIILFRNYKSFKRSCIYGSIYVVLATLIVISNIYVSGLNKIEEVLYYQNYASDERYKNKYDSNFDKQSQDKEDKKEDKTIDNTVSQNYQYSKEDTETSKNIDESLENYKDSNQDKKESDTEIINNFKQDIYDIERIALIPMRECMIYTKDISKNLAKLESIKEDIEYAQYKCIDVIDIYDTMEIPELSNQEYEIVLDNAKNDVKKAYELREKAMGSASKLIETKNPKYIGKLTEYLSLSDKQIASFKERMNDLKEKVNK